MKQRFPFPLSVVGLLVVLTGIAVGQSRGRLLISAPPIGANDPAAGWTSNGQNTSTSQTANIAAVDAGAALFSAGVTLTPGPLKVGASGISTDGGVTVTLGTVANTSTGVGFTSAAASGTNGFACSTNGCRFDFGAGASDYASSDGTTVTFAGPTAITNDANTIQTLTGSTSAGTLGLVTNSNAGGFANWRAKNDGTTFAQLGIFGSARAAYGAIASGDGNFYTTAAGLVMMADNASGIIKFATGGNTETGRISTGGQLQMTAGNGTAGSGTGITVNATGTIRPFVHKITVAETALAAAATSDITLWTVPAKTRMLRLVAAVTAQHTGGGVTAVDVTCGTSAGGNQYLLSFDADAAAATFGDVAAEIGAGLLSATVADIPSFSGTTAVQCRYTCTGGNCDLLTAGSTTFYLEGVTYP